MKLWFVSDKKKAFWGLQDNLEGIGHAIDEGNPQHFLQEIRTLYPKLEQFGMRMPMIEPVKIGKAEYDSTWHDYHITFLKCLRRYGRHEDFSLNQWNDDVDREADKRRRHVIEASSPAHASTITINHNDGTYSIGEGEHRFKIHWSPHNEDTIYLYKVGERGHIALVTDAEAIDEIKDPSSYNESPKLVIGEGQMAVLRNGHGNWATVKIIKVEKEKRELTIHFTPLVPGRSCAPYS